MESTEPTDTGSETSPQHFLVEYQGRVYVTAVLEATDPSDERFQEMWRSATDFGRAIPLLGVAVKSVTFGNIDEVSFGNINEANFGNIRPDDA